MKPFNLEKALAGEPVVTRDGQKVKQLVLFNNVAGSHPLIGVVGNSIRCWRSSGEASVLEKENEFDLFMATKKRTVWVNFYARGDSIWFDDKTQAEENAPYNLLRPPIAIAVPVEIEE